MEEDRIQAHIDRLQTALSKRSRHITTIERLAKKSTQGKPEEVGLEMAKSISSLKKHYQKQEIMLDKLRQLHNEKTQTQSDSREYTDD